MDILQTVVGTAVLAALGLVLAWMGNQRFEALERALAAQGDGLRTDLRRLDDKVEDKVGRLEGKIDALRADLTQIALAVGARSPNR